MLAPQHDHLRLIDWNNLHLALEWVYQGSPLFKRRVVRHQIPGLSAWWVRKGRVTVSGPTVTVRGEVGDWIFLPYHEDERHFSDDAEILSIRFQANWGGDNELLQESEPRTCHGREVPILERRATALLRAAGPLLTSRQSAMQFEPIPLFHHLALRNTFLAWFETYLRTLHRLGATFHRVQVTDERVRRTKIYLDTVPLHQPLQEIQLAQHVGLSVTQLHRLFVDEMGSTPKAYHTERKVRAARTLLITTDMPIKQIGYELGFSDPANFTNWFRTQSALSPKAFRNKAMRSP